MRQVEISKRAKKANKANVKSMWGECKVDLGSRIAFDISRTVNHPLGGAK